MQMIHGPAPNPSSAAGQTAAPPNVPTPASPAISSSLLDRPAQQAKIRLASGKLTVQADNSTLSEILHQVSQAGGMKIEGLQKSASADQRIFGSYGPGAPREVLSELLDGSGFNVMMLGETTSGVPRELALTSQSLAAPGALGAQPQPSTPSQDEDNDNEIEPTQYPDERQQNLNPPSAPPEMRDGARTPQQLLQELQRIRRQQQQQPDQQPN